MLNRSARSAHRTLSGIRTRVASRDASTPASFDHRLRPPTLRTAMAIAFFWPTSTTNRLPLVDQSGCREDPLQHGVVLSEHRDYHGRVFR